MLLPVLAVILGTQSCIDQNNFDFEGLNSATVNPNMAIPLLHGKLTIADLLPKEESSYVITDDDNLIHIIYSDTLESRSILEFFLLEPLIEERTYPVVTPSIDPDGKIVDDQILLNLDFQKADFDEIILKAGKVTLTVYSDAPADTEVQLHFPTLTKDGQALTKNLSFPGANTSAQTEVIDLSGYVIDLSAYGLGNNNIPVNVVATTTNAQVGAGQVSARLEIDELQYSFLTGYFGQVAVDLPSDSIQLEVFNNIFSKANFGLKNPGLSFDFLNSNGAPIQAQIRKFDARNAAGETLAILTDPANNILIEAPLNPGEETVKKLTVLNEEEVIQFAPTAIVYEFSGSLNPGGDARPANPNFLTDKSRAAVVLHADLPLWGYLEGFTLTDTVELGIGLENEQDYIKEAAIKILIKNQLPLNGELKIDFVNANNEVIETLFDTDAYENLLPGSVVDANGEVVEEGVYDREIQLSSQKFEKILSAEKMIVRANLATSKLSDGSFPHVKIKADQALSINMGIKASANNLKVEL